MKSQTIRLTGKKQVDYAAKLINECLDQPELWCCEIKKHKEAKTLQQLRGLFGIWYDYLSETLGYTKDELHQIHKFGWYDDGAVEHGGWLVQIFWNDPQGKIQEMWAEHLTHLYSKFNNEDFSKENGEALSNHQRRASLSWATIDQMREYMTRIEHYYLNAGYPLPILEQYRKYYEH